MATSQATIKTTIDNDTNFSKNETATKQMLANNASNNNNTRVNVVTVGQLPSWQKCYYCPMESFKTSADFVKHLRDRHCTREGGSYVCRYGFNGVCPSLPLDGVSDRDYDAHVAKYHVTHQSREMPPEWSVFSAAQNLPAVLNDPSRGKQQNLFTKKWGDSFIEKTAVTNTSRLPEITYADFDKYIHKIGKRYRRHERLSAQVTPSTVGERTSQSNGSPARDTDLSSIPDIFLKETIELNQPATFSLVFPGIGSSTSDENKQTARLLQEQLSHYLDIVEVKIAHQVSQKSGAFFHAMTSQHAIMSEMHKANQKVRELRASLKSLHTSVVEDSFRVMRYAQRKQNFEETIDKLCLMATVHKTQPMLQLLMGTQDYVAALDLISTTEEILNQELIGVHCFKHLPMQLSEMEKLIDKILTTEFERYATMDLNRPLGDVLKETDSVCAEEDKLVCIVMGLLRKNNLSFVNTYKDEAISTIRAIIKQLVIEVISSSDAELCLTGAGEESQSLTISEWICLLEKATIALLTVLQRIKAVTGIMRQTADAAAGRCGNSFGSINDNQEPAVNLIDSEAFLTATDNMKVHEKLQDLLIAVCNYCHERCANLVSSQSLEKCVATQEEIEQLQIIVNDFSAGCESICGSSSVPLKVAVKVQASRFANRFHSDRKKKISLLLDSERWRQVDIPNEFQKLIDYIDKGDFSSNPILTNLSPHDNLPNGHINHTPTPNPILLIEGKPYALVSAALILVQVLCEYCRCAQRLPLVAGYLSRNVVDLLRTFNSRSCQLVIGAGAMRVAGLKTITSTNLALVSRALQLVVWILPKLRSHFESMDPNAVSGYEAIEKDFHSHIKEIENKIHGIVTERLNAELEQWSARPPIPSQCFRNISRHLVKLYEAVAAILPEEQIHVIYGIVHRNFKDKLRKQLSKLNIVNNGGPQHGVVTSELTFYMETINTLKALPQNGTHENLLETIWLY